MVTLIHTRGDRSLSELVDLDHGLVSREIYVNEAIYQQELEQIYARAWLFIGHESQVPNPGDFVVSRMGEEEVLLVRARKGQIGDAKAVGAHRRSFEFEGSRPPAAREQASPLADPALLSLIESMNNATPGQNPAPPKIE